MPIKLRLTLAFAVGMAVVLTGLGAFLHVRLGSELLASIDFGLRSRAQVIEAGLGSRNFAEQTRGLIDPDEAFAQILDPAGAIRESSPNVAGTPLVSPSDLPSGPVRFLERSIPGQEAPVRLLIAREQEGRLYIVVGATLSDRQEALDRQLAELAIGGPIALILTSVAGWLLAGAALRPVERIRLEAAAISSSEPDRRLPVPAANDEVQRLAETLNEMLGRLQGSIARERRFLDDASHELRTPLAVLKGELDLALSRARSPEDLEASIRRAATESDRLAALADDLLVLARSREGSLALQRRVVSLSPLVMEAVDGRRITADAAGVEVRVAIDDVDVDVDRTRVRQAIENLLDNAIRHAPRGSAIWIRAEEDEDEFRIAVQDQGPGFAARILPQAFQPFVSDGSGDRGAGLGLAIVDAVAQAHGGTARAENPPGGGAMVTLALPR